MSNEIYCACVECGKKEVMDTGNVKKSFGDLVLGGWVNLTFAAGEEITGICSVKCADANAERFMEKLNKAYAKGDKMSNELTNVPEFPDSSEYNGFVTVQMIRDADKTLGKLFYEIVALRGAHEDGHLPIWITDAVQDAEMKLKSAVERLHKLEVFAVTFKRLAGFLMCETP